MRLALRLRVSAIAANEQNTILERRSFVRILLRCKSWRLRDFFSRFFNHVSVTAFVEVLQLLSI